MSHKAYRLGKKFDLGKHHRPIKVMFATSADKNVVMANLSKRIAHRAGEEENVISRNNAIIPGHSANASKSGLQFCMTSPLKIAQFAIKLLILLSISSQLI